MRERIELQSSRLVGDPCTHVLTGQFLISPVGWLPKGKPQSAMAISFVSLAGLGADDDVGEVDAMLFSAN